MLFALSMFSNTGNYHDTVYINDVALAAGESLIHLYADDTILYTGPSLGTVLTSYGIGDACVPLGQKPGEMQRGKFK